MTEKIKESIRTTYTILLIMGLLISLLFAGYDVKKNAEDANKAAALNKQLIEKNYNEFKLYVEEQHIMQQKIAELKTELRMTRESAEQLYKSIEDLKKEFIKKGMK